MVDYFPVEDLRKEVNVIDSYTRIVAKTPRKMFEGTRMERLLKPERNRSTTAHEFTHYISSNLRGRSIKNPDLQGMKYNGFYIANYGGIYLMEPAFPTSKIINYVPKSIQGPMTHYINKKGWEDRPLYLVDEWVAFYSGGLVAIEDFNTKKHDGEKFGAVSGLLEISMYCICFSMCIFEEKKDYWYNFPEFRFFLMDQLIRSQKVFKLGHEIDLFRSNREETFLKGWQLSADSKKIEDFVANELEGAWVF